MDTEKLAPILNKEEVAATFAIPGKRISNIEPLIENLKYLIVKEEFSGRSASSEVRLRFRLHPLEEELLAQLDASEEVSDDVDAFRRTNQFSTIS